MVTGEEYAQSRAGPTRECGAKQMVKGWSYPKHLAGRAYGVVVHGDVSGIEATRRALSDWLDRMGLVRAGSLAQLDRFIGYYAPYATSHDALDADRRRAGGNAQRRTRSGERRRAPARGSLAAA